MEYAFTYAALIAMIGLTGILFLANERYKSKRYWRDDDE